MGPSVNFGGSRSDSLGNTVVVIYMQYITTGDDDDGGDGGDWYIPVLHTHTHTYIVVYSIIYIFCIYNIIRVRWNLPRPRYPPPVDSGGRAVPYTKTHVHSARTYTYIICNNDNNNII